jgi:hypothetical protein
MALANIYLASADRGAAMAMREKDANQEYGVAALFTYIRMFH